jgi:glutaredoxin
MTKRKNLGKGLRFEVFKRDTFTCQYCGQKPPDVVLQVDHIMPVAAGGDNDISNLVTACEACNQGKKAKRLDLSPRPDADLTWLEMQQELAELRRYQMAKAERDQLTGEIIKALQFTWQRVSGLDWTPAGHVLQQMMNKYSPDMVEEAILAVAPKVAGGYVRSDRDEWLKYMHGTLRHIAEMDGENA